MNRRCAFRAAFTDGSQAIIIGTLGPGRPRLSIGHSGNQLLISWPSTATNAVLECTTTLTSAADWRSITTGVTDDGATRSISIGNTGNTGTQFYRLAQP